MSRNRKLSKQQGFFYCIGIFCALLLPLANKHLSQGKFGYMTRFLFSIILLLWSYHSQANTDTIILKNHLKNITKTPAYRNHQNLTQLNAIAAYIKTDFLKYSDSVSFQEYEVDGKMYKNVICFLVQQTNNV